MFPKLFNCALSLSWHKAQALSFNTQIAIWVLKITVSIVHLRSEDCQTS